MKTLVALLLMSGTVFAQASRVPIPKLKDVLADDMVAKARIRWSKVVEGERVAATVNGGEAFRHEQAPGARAAQAHLRPQQEPRAW